MDLNNLLRDPLKRFSAYEPGEQPTGDGWIKLNTNENPFPPVPEILELLSCSQFSRSLLPKDRRA